MSRISKDKKISTMLVEIWIANKENPVRFSCFTHEYISVWPWVHSSKYIRKYFKFRSFHYNPSLYKFRQISSAPAPALICPVRLCKKEFGESAFSFLNWIIWMTLIIFYWKWGSRSSIFQKLYWATGQQSWVQSRGWKCSM